MEEEVEVRKGELRGREIECLIRELLTSSRVRRIIIIVEYGESKKNGFKTPAGS